MKLLNPSLPWMGEQCSGLERSFFEAILSREEMKTRVSMDVPTSRWFHREYYLAEPYFDVRFEADPQAGDGVVGRFIHDPLLSLYGSQMWKDTAAVLVLRSAPAFCPRHIYPSERLLKALRRLVEEP